MAYTNIPRTGTGTIGTEYKFIESADTDLPYFSSTTTLWNTIYSYQVLNVLIGNFSSTNISGYFLSTCYLFNQPLDIVVLLLLVIISYLVVLRSINH